MGKNLQTFHSFFIFGGVVGIAIHFFWRGKMKGMYQPKVALLAKNPFQEIIAIFG